MSKYPEYIYESAESWGETFFFAEEQRKDMIAVLSEGWGLKPEDLEEDYCEEYERLAVLDEGALYGPIRAAHSDHLVIVEAAHHQPGVYNKLEWINRETAEEEYGLADK